MKNVGQYMENYRAEMIDALSKLVACPSVRGDAAPNMPFGQGNRDALDRFLAIGESFGMKTFDADGYAGHVEYGEGEELAAALAHLDVVPVGDLAKWNTDPFVMTEKDGVLYGRGVGDDKGAAVSALFALKMFKDQGLKLDRRIRVIAGCAEETASNDLEYYFEKTETPSLSFTPDAGFPIINREKGRLVYKFYMPYEGDSVIAELRAGTAENVVIDKCAAYTNLTVLPATEAPVSAELENGKVVLKTVGKSAHGAAPFDGINAASLMFKTLYEIETNAAIKTFLAFAVKCIGSEWDGLSMGVKMSDEESGDLTANLGLFSIADGKCEATIDIRYPVTKVGKDVVLALDHTAKENSVFGAVSSCGNPLYVPADSELVKKLSEAYEMHTGKPSIPKAIGGGTYAKSLPNGTCVAFGGVGGGAHQPNEYVNIDEFMECAKIIAQAMYNIAMK